MDPTKIDVPFGELGEEMYAALFTHLVRGGEIEYKSRPSDCFRKVVGVPSWNPSVIYRAAPAKPFIDWSHVNRYLNWLSVDHLGRGWLYLSKPQIREDRWSVPEQFWVCADYFSSFVPGAGDWRDSLICRPGTEDAE